MAGLQTMKQNAQVLIIRVSLVICLAKVTNCSFFVDYLWIIEDQRNGKMKTGGNLMRNSVLHTHILEEKNS